MHLIFLLVSGYSDEKQLSLYNDFFNEKINNTLEKLKHNDQEIDILAFDLLEAIRNITIASDIKPSLAILNEIWAAKEYYGTSYIDNPYCQIVLFALGNHGVEEIISQAHITMSFIYIEKRLLTFNITRENGKYDLESFNNPKSNNDSDHVTLNNEKTNKDSIKKILQQWIKKFESELESINFFKLRRDRLIYIMCRYIDWGKSIGLDKQIQLSNSIKYFLENVNVRDGEKKAIIEIIIDECKNHSELIYRKKQETMFEFLFDNNIELIKCINEFSDKMGGIKNIDFFRNVVILN